MVRSVTLVAVEVIDGLRRAHTIASLLISFQESVGIVWIGIPDILRHWFPAAR